MGKLQHKNLLNFGSKEEVYEALQQHYDRDTWIHSFWNLVIIGSAAGAYFMGHKDWLWIFLGLYAVERALARFIDNSNRNWTMHLIDWMELDRQKAKVDYTGDNNESSL